ncbi:hypothetical protein [Lutibacter sp.]
MKKALNAKSIGDKLYNIERIHSKIISYSINNGLDENDTKKIIQELHKLVECFGEFHRTKKYYDYIQSIKQTIFLIETNNDYSESLNYMHSCFVKFREEIKKKLKKGCEIEYQDVCLPLYLSETQIKKKKSTQHSI